MFDKYMKNEPDVYFAASFLWHTDIVVSGAANDKIRQSAYIQLEPGRQIGY